MRYAAPYAAFQKSRHYELLRVSDNRGPTCVTCHGESAAQLLAPASVEAECNQCHGPGKRAPRPEPASQVRDLLERVRELRAQLEVARRMIAELRDTTRQQRLQAEYQQTEAPLIQTISDGHSFVFTSGEQQLNLTRERLAKLYQSIIAVSGR